MSPSAAREWRLRQAANRKAAKDLEKLDIKCPPAVVTGLCPACGYENEDLAHPWWNCEAEQHAHIREKAPQHTNVEDMHPAYRDMMLVKKDTQLLNWGKENRTNEVAAVAAAEELRRKVEGARNRDDGSKKKCCEGCRRTRRMPLWGGEGGRTGRATMVSNRESRSRSLLLEKQKDEHTHFAVRHPCTGNADAHTHGL